jgi:hypothetical protein
MEAKIVERLRDWTEPAHPAVVKLYDDLTAIYTLIRDKAQPRIDSAFDSVSRKIGYVVATTLPVVIEVGEEGKNIKIMMGAEHLNGTLFDQAITEVLRGLPFTGLTAGRYQIYVLWHDALRLKLHADWMEPAHFHWMEPAHFGSDRFGRVSRASQAATAVRPEVREPAHWFDPGWALTVEEAVSISAIDVVYPELRLGNQIAAYRQLQRQMIRPEVKEPAHTHLSNIIPGR